MIPAYYNYLVFEPFIPGGNDMPPRLYHLMESIVNFGKTDKTKIRNLAKEARTTIFDFSYPLTTNISKEDFECMILNHFINRRIGFETFTLFQIQLENKLNSIMPLYNKMFDSIEGWDLFNDGETITRDLSDNKKGSSTSNLENSATASNTTVSDRRFSDTPENELENIKDGKYATEYNYDTNTGSSKDDSTSKGTATSDDTQTVHETIKHTPADKIAIYKEMQENIQSIYNLIFKDLDCLFYQLI